ncbi:MAG: hypothetical protein LBR07_05595, partial [Puniceicoccales bacterium]|nr:hypothetical protein [Puniceicoccales bacterium]
QTIRGAWPDWWTDGFGTGQREAAALRKTSAAATAAQTALALAKLLGAKIPQSTTGELAEIYKQLLFYGEHTFGANDSVSRPHDLRAWDQRNIKQSYVWDAVRRTGVLTENATGLLQTFTPPATVPTLVVFNPLNFAFTGITRVFLDQQIVPHGRDFEITDAAGNRVPAQFDGERWSDGAYWNVFVKNVPPLGFAQYKITVKKERAKRPFSVRKMTYTIGENQFYRFQFNRERGTLISLYDKELKRELLTRNTPQKTPAAAPAAWEFGQFIYETIDNREKTVNGCPTCRGGYKKNFKQPDFKRRAPEKMRFDYYERGEIYDLYRFVGETIAGEGANNLVVEYRTYNTTKKIEVAHYLRKRSETSPEAVYVAFPLAIENGKIFLDETGGEFEAGVGQLRGSANDYYTVQNYAAARNGAMQALVVSPEIPLMQFGAINTARYTAGAVLQNTNIYSWPMNNYWFTNFNAMQFGGTRWRHFITSLADTSPATATRFAFANRIPMLTRVLPAAGNANTEKIPVKTTLAATAVPAVPVNSTPAETAVSATPLPPPASFLSITGGNVLLARAFPLTGENAIVLQLREIAGNPASLRITSPRATLTAITECDPLGDPLPHTADGTIAGDATTGSTAGTTTGDRTADAAGKISLRPWETKFVKIHF